MRVDFAENLFIFFHIKFPFEMSLWWRQAGMKAIGRMVQEGWDEMKLWTREVYVSDKDDNNETDKWFLWLLLGTFENK